MGQSIPLKQTSFKRPKTTIFEHSSKTTGPLLFICCVWIFEATRGLVFVLTFTSSYPKYSAAYSMPTKLWPSCFPSNGPMMN